MKPKLNPTTPLERHVARWLRMRAKDSYDGDLKTVLQNLFYGGCQSGIVGHLIYCADTRKFYLRYQEEIDGMISRMIDEGCLNSLSDLRNWDKSDPLARGDNNINILAWFGFEETARALADQAGIEI